MEKNKFYELAFEAASTDDFEKAEENYKKAIETEPKRARIYANYAELLRKYENIEESRVQIDKALELDADDSYIQLIFLRIARMQGDIENGLKYGEQLLELDEVSDITDETLTIMNWIYYDAQQYRNAAAVSIEAIERVPDIAADALGCIAGSLFYEGFYSDAYFIIEKGLELAPDDEWMIENRAIIGESLKDAQDSAITLVGMDLEDGDPEKWETLLQLELSTGNPDILKDINYFKKSFKNQIEQDEDIASMIEYYEESMSFIEMIREALKL